jgi:hypothetical protein
MPSANGVLSNDGATFEQASPGGWSCATRGSVGWTTGVHTWTVRLDRVARGISVGISRKDICPKNAHENSSLRYDMYGGLGVAVDPSNHQHLCFLRSVRNKDEVTIRLDLDASTLTFGLNGHLKPKPTFTNIPKGEWFPYFALQTKGAKFSVVEQIN